MNAAAFIRIAKRLYGPQWRKPMSVLLKRDPATIRRWLARNEIPPVVALAVSQIAKRS